MSSPEDTEKTRINIANSVELFAAELPDADPNMLMAAGMELSAIAESFRKLQDLGLLKGAVVLIKLSNEKIIQASYGKE